MPKLSTAHKYLTIKEAASYLGVSTKTLRRWEASGKLEAERTEGGHRRYALVRLQGFKKAKKAKAKRKPVTSTPPVLDKQPIPVAAVKPASPIVAPVKTRDEVSIFTPLHINQKKALKAFAYASFAVIALAMLTKAATTLPKFLNSNTDNNRNIAGNINVFESFLPDVISSEVEKSEAEGRVLADRTSLLSSRLDINIDTNVDGILNVANTITSTDDLLIDPGGGGVNIGGGTPANVTLTGDDLFVSGDIESGADIYAQNGTFSAGIAVTGDASVGSLTINTDVFTDLTGTGLQVTDGALETTLGTSITSAEITDGTITEADLSVTNAATDNQILSYDSSSGGFTWVDDSTGDTSLWTDGGTTTYLTSQTDDLAIGGTDGSAAFFFDESAGDLTITGTLNTNTLTDGTATITGGAGTGFTALTIDSLTIDGTTLSSSGNLTLDSSAGSLILTGFDCSGNANGGVLTADASGVVTCDDDDSGAGGSSEFTDTGTIIHPNESTLDSLALGGTTEAGADIFLGVSGNAVFNEQGNDADFKIEGASQDNLFFVDASTDRVNVGGDSTPDALFTVGSTSQFQVNTSGQITAATDETINGIDISSGAVSDVTTLTASSTITGGTITDGTASISSGVGSGFLSLTSDSLTLNGTTLSSTSALSLTSAASGDITLTASDDIIFDDAQIGGTIQLSDTEGSFLSGDTGIIDAINTAYTAATGGSGGTWMHANHYLYPAHYWADDLIIGGNATASATFQVIAGSGNISTDGDITLGGNDIFDSGSNNVISFDGSGNIDTLGTIATTITQSGNNQVTLTGNVDAQNGLDVTNANLTIGGSYSFSTAGVITAATNETINGIDINAGAVSDITTLSASSTVTFSSLVTDGYVTVSSGVLSSSATVATTDLSGTLFSTDSDDSSPNTIVQGDTLTIAGGTNVTTTHSGDTLTVNLDDSITLSGDIAVNGGDVTSTGELAFTDTRNSAIELSASDVGFDSGDTAIIDAINSAYDAATGGAGSLWNHTDHALFPAHYWADDLIIGGNSTASADIQLFANGDITADGTITFSNLSTDGYITVSSGVLSSSATVATTDLSGTIFSVTGDSGTPETIEQGNTFDVAGGTNITTAVGATDTVTVNLDDSITLAGDLTVQGGNVNFDNATDLDIDDNTANVFTISESTNNYIEIDTTDSSEAITIGNSIANTDITLNVGTSGYHILQRNGSALDCSGQTNGGVLTTNSSGQIICDADDGGGASSEWTDTGSIVHPNEETVDEIAIGGTTEAGADIFLGVDGWTVFNEQGNDVDFRIEANDDGNIVFVDGTNNNVAIGSNTPQGKLYVTTNTDAHIGKASLIINQVENQDVFTASASGSTLLTLGNSGNLQLGANGNDGSLTLYNELGGTDYTVTFNTSGSQGANITYTLPPDDGTADYVLVTDGAGVLTWQEVTGIGGAGDITAVGDVTSGAAFTETAGDDGNSLWFEGTTSDSNELELTAADVGDDTTTVTLPAITGTLASLAGTQTFTGAKTFDDITIADTSINLSGGTTTFQVSGTGEVVLSSSGFYPATTDSNALGTTTNMWSDLFLASGSVINFDNGDVTVTHAAESLTFAGGGFAFNLDSTTELDVTKTAAAAATEEGIDLTFTSGAGDGSDVYSALRISATSANHTASSDKLYGINIANLTSADAEGDESAIFVGTGWDSILDYNGTTIIDGTGNVQAGQISGTLFTTNSDSASSNNIDRGDELTIAGGTNITTSHSGDTITVTLDDNVTLAGDLGVNGGDITTNQTTFNLVNSTATTLNIGGAATTLSLGAGTGTTTVNNALTVTGTTTANGTFDANGIVTLGDGGDAITISGTTVGITSNSAGNDITLTSADDIIFDDAQIGGTIQLSDSAGSFDSGDTGIIDAINAAYNAATGGTGALLSHGDHFLYPTEYWADDLIIGGNSTASATFQVISTSGNVITDGTISVEGSIFDTSDDVLTINDDIKVAGNDIVDSGDSTRITLGATTTFTNTTTTFSGTTTLNATSATAFNLGAATLDFNGAGTIQYGNGSNFVIQDDSGADILNLAGGTDVLSFGNATDNNAFTFLGTGTLTTGGSLDINGSSSDIAGTLNLSGGALTATGDLSIDTTGNNVEFADEDVLNIGGIVDQTTNAISNVGATIDFASTDNDLYIEDILEVDGTIYGTTFDTTFTQGSVVFAGASGVLSEDNSNLFWDNTANNLYIGTNNPANNSDSRLFVTGNSTLTGKAVAILDQTESQDIFSASASGSTRFTIANDGSIAQTTTATTGDGYLLTANSITTGDIFELTGTGFTTGRGSYLNLSSTTTTAGSFTGQNITISDTGATTSTDNTYGQYIDVTRTGASSGTNRAYGLYSTVSGDTNGSATRYGAYTLATGGDTNYAFLGQAQTSASTTYSNVTGVAGDASVQNSSVTLSTLKGGDFTAQNIGSSVSLTNAYGVASNLTHAASGTITNGYGTTGAVYNASTGTITTASALYGEITNDLGPSTIGTAYGLNISGITSSGTITDTYGVYVGDITSGTQTNTPFSFYASDASAYNYFAGNTGIGDTSPASLFTVGNGDLFQVDSTGSIVNIDGVAHTIADESGALRLTSNTGADIEIYGTDDIIFDDAQIGGTIQLSDTDGTLPNSNTGIIDAINDAYTAATGGAGATTWTLDSNTLYPATLGDRVGIGTQTAASIESKLYLTSSATTLTGKSLAILDQTESQDIFTASASGTTRFTIDSAGNVGINVDPAEPLHILTDAGGQAIRIEENSGGEYFNIGVESSGDLLFVDDEGATKLEIINDIVQAIDIPNRIRHIGDTDTYLDFADDSQAFYAGGVAFLQISESTINTFQVNPTSVDIDFKVRSDNDQYNIFSNGGTDKVGIGLNTPEGKLHVANDNGSTHIAKALLVLDQYESQDIFTASASGSTVFTMQNDGDIVVGDAGNNAGIYLADTTSSFTPYIESDFSGNKIKIGIDTTNFIDFGGGSSGSNWSVANSDVNLTTTQFDVTLNGYGEVFQANTTNGVILNDDGLASNDFRIEGDTDANLFFADAGIDTVGIGTGSPASKFHVSGNHDGNALVTFNETGGQDIFTASASGTTRLTLRNDGDLYISGALNAGGATEQAYNFFGSSISDNDTAVDTNDLYIEDALEVQGNSRFEGDNTYSLAGSENIDIDNLSYASAVGLLSVRADTASGSNNSSEAVDITFTNTDDANAEAGLSGLNLLIDNRGATTGDNIAGIRAELSENSTADLNYALYIDNNDTTQVIRDGIYFDDNGGGGYSDLIDTSSSVFRVDGSGNTYLADDVNLVFGTGSDFTKQFNSTELILNTTTALTASSNVDYGLYTLALDNANAGMTADQEVFEIGKGANDDSEANWVELFTLDEDGDAYFAGSITVTSCSGCSGGAGQWSETDLALYPNEYWANDVLVGSNATSSASFAFANIDSSATGNTMLRLLDDIELVFGTGEDVIQTWETADADAHYLSTVLSGSNNWIINADTGTDWTHAANTDPTLYVQSADATSVADYISLSHNQTDAYINVGTGALNLLPSGETDDYLTLSSDATDLTFNTAGSAALNITSNAASTWQTSAGDLTIDAAAASLNLNGGEDANDAIVLTADGGTSAGIDLVASSVTTADAFDFTAAALTTGVGLDIDVNALTTGDAVNIGSTSTALDTGSLLAIDWSATGTNTSSADLFTINIGADDTANSLLNITDNGSDVFKVSQTLISNAVPAEFTAAGDVSFAYDIQFTNQTASYLKSKAPLYIEAGESFENNDLTLYTYNLGDVVFENDDEGVFATFGGNGTATISNTTGQLSGKAALIVDQYESQDIFTASASGVNVLSLTSTGNLLPGSDDSQDLGSDSLRWANLYLGAETLHIGTSTSDEGFISYTTSSNLLTFNSDGDLAFQADADATNYLTLSSDATDLTLATTDGADLTIAPAGAITNITGALDVTTNITADGSIGIDVDTSANNILNTSAGTATTSDLYWGDDLVCDASETNCGWATSSGSSPFTLDTGMIYPNEYWTNDLIIGGNSTASALFQVITESKDLAYNPSNSGTFTITSDLSGGNRTVPTMTITQPDTGGGQAFSGDYLLLLEQLDTNSINQAIGITQSADAGSIRIDQDTSLTNDLLDININSLTSGDAINITSNTSGSTVGTTGNYIFVTDTDTYTGSSTRTDSGNFIDLNRSLTVNNASGTVAITGDLATFSSNCTQTSGTCTDTSNILQLTQSYASATGAVLDIGNSGAGDSLQINTTDFIVDTAGLVGIGIDPAAAWLDITPSTTANASLGLGSGATPSSPTAGDVYSDGTDIFFYNGSTWDDLTGGGTTYWTKTTGALHPNNYWTDDLLIGSNATSSALFSVDVFNKDLAYNPSNSGTFTITSDLSGGARDTNPALYINQTTGTISDTTTTGLLHIFQQETNSSIPLIYLDNNSGDANGVAIDIVDSPRGIDIAGVSSGINISNATTGIDFANVSGNTGIDIGSVTSGTGIVFSGGGSSATAFTGDLLRLAQARTFTGTTTSDTGNYLDIQRSRTINSSAQTLTLAGDLASLSSNCTETSGTCTDTSNILQLTQSYVNATGDVLDISNTGGGTSLNIAEGSWGKAAAIINQNGAQEVFTASVSGSTVFNIEDSGQAGGIIFIDPSSSAPTCDTAGDIYTDSTNVYYCNGSTWDDLTAGGSSEWTLSGTTVHPNLATTDMAVGVASDTLVAPFSVDESTNTVRIGEGSGSNGTLNIYSSAGDTGSIAYTTSDTWNFTGGSVDLDGDLDLDSNTATALTVGDGSTNFLTIDATADAADTVASFVSTGVSTGTLASFAADSITTGIGLDLSVDAITTGTALNVTSTYNTVTGSSTALLGNFDWSPSSTDTATGDLFRINIGANGTIGNLLNITDAGSTLFKVSETTITSALPHEFTAAGDVSIAYDIQFTNQTSSYIKSNAPLAIEAGENTESNNLTLATYNSGEVVFSNDDSGTIGRFEGEGTFTITNTTGALNGKSALIVDQDESEHILTASASGTTEFVIANDGKMYIGDNTTLSVSTGLCWESTTINGATVYQVGDCNSTPTDLAENFGTSDESIEAGDVVAITGQAEEVTPKGLLTSKAWVRKATGAYDTELLGVVSTQPNQTYGGDELFSEEENPRPVSLAGRVPVKVSTQNGDIKAGDFLTSSSISGVAMKATSTGYVIGRALADYTNADPSAVGKVVVYVNPMWYSPASSEVAGLESRISELELEVASLTATESANFTDLNLDNLTVSGDTLLGDTTIAGTLDVGTIQFDGFTNSINSVGIMKVQSLALANIEFMGGLITFDTDGNITVNEITANKFNVAGASAGTAILPANTFEVFVESTAVTADSLIFVNPKSPIFYPLSVVEKVDGQGFWVEIYDTEVTDTEFDWWIVDKK